MTPDELEKQIKSLGAELVTLREELKAIQSAPKPDPVDVAAIRAEIKTITDQLDALKTTDKKNDPPPPPPAGASPAPRRRGFGFF